MPPQQSQLHCIEHDLEVVQLADERDAALFQRLMHPRIASCSSQEDDPLPEVRRPGHESVVEIESVDLGHQEVAHHRGNARIGRDHLQGPAPGIRLQDGEPGTLEELPQRAPHGALIVYQQDRGHALAWKGGAPNLGPDLPVVQRRAGATFGAACPN